MKCLIESSKFERTVLLRLNQINERLTCVLKHQKDESFLKNPVTHQRNWKICAPC